MNLYERYLGGLGPSVDDELVLTVRQETRNGKGVTVIERDDAGDPASRYIFVIENCPLEIRFTSHGIDVANVKMRRL